MYVVMCISVTTDLEGDAAGDLVEGTAGDEVTHDAGRAAAVQPPEAIPLPHVVHWRTDTAGQKSGWHGLRQVHKRASS